MKIVLILCLSLLSASAMASTRTIQISDRDAAPARAQLPKKIISYLRSSGFKFKKRNDGIYTISVKGFGCNTESNDNLDTPNPELAIETVECRQGAKFNGGHYDGGTALSNAGGLAELFNDEQYDLQLGDCSMGGHCTVGAELINCSVDSKVDTINGAGRFSCTIQDSSYGFDR